MSNKVTFSMLQVDIEEAIKNFVLDRLSTGYSFELDKLDVDFEVSEYNGRIRISCTITTMVKEKGSSDE